MGTQYVDEQGLLDAAARATESELAQRRAGVRVRDDGDASLHVGHDLAPRGCCSRTRGSFLLDAASPGSSSTPAGDRFWSPCPLLHLARSVRW